MSDDEEPCCQHGVGVVIGLWVGLRCLAMAPRSARCVQKLCTRTSSARCLRAAWFPDRGKRCINFTIDFWQLGREAHDRPIDRVGLCTLANSPSASPGRAKPQPGTRAMAGSGFNVEIAFFRANGSNFLPMREIRAVFLGIPPVGHTVYAKLIAVCVMLRRHHAKPIAICLSKRDGPARHHPERSRNRQTLGVGRSGRHYARRSERPGRVRSDGL